MKKKGFTLIELLAVIVVLAIIALIATPMVLDTIEKSRKGAASSSTYSYISEVETKLASYMLKHNGDSYNNGKYHVTKLQEDLGIELKGSIPSEGNICIGGNGQVIEASIKMNDYIVHYDGKTATTTDLKEIEDIACNGAILQETKVYGVKRAIETESTSWERTDDAIGLIANAQIGTTTVQNDFDNIYPWSEIKSYNYNIETKQITAWYGDDNFKFDGSNGEVLTYIPEFYYKRIQENGYEYISISKEEQPGYIRSEAFSVGRYTMSGDATRTHSRSGYKPLVNTTINDFRNYARNLGEEFGQLDYHYFILQILYLVEYADYNSQVKLGKGYTNGSHTSPVTSGGCDFLGMKSGSVNGTDNTSVIYRGIEDIFGNVWQFVDGINIKDNQTYICYNQEKYESDKFDGCYKQIGYVNASNSEYASKLGYDSANSMVALTTEAIGSSNNNTCDYYYQADGNRIAAVGGAWNSDSRAGLWYWSFGEASSSSIVALGARLIKVG